MLTKFFMHLFVPYRWEIIETKQIQVYRNNNDLVKNNGTQFILKNQYGDLKFKTIWMDGREGEY